MPDLVFITRVPIGVSYTITDLRLLSDFRVLLPITFISSISSLHNIEILHIANVPLNGKPRRADCCARPLFVFNYHSVPLCLLILTLIVGHNAETDKYSQVIGSYGAMIL